AAIGERQADGAARPAIAARARNADLPLSFAQQRLWFLAQLEGVSDAYHLPLALHLKGRPDVPALPRALDTLWSRHEALRSIFVHVDGQPVVRLLDVARGIPLRQIDAHAREVPEICERESRSPFDLAAGPLVRARLIRLADDAHVFLLTLHHIVF